jgi:hypothetical protein
MSYLAATRQRLFDLVSASTDLPVYRWLPGTTDDLPCYVIGRPDLDEQPQARAVQQLTIPVYALGRTMRDDDAQAQLDDLADDLTNLLWKPPQEPGQSMRLTRLRATVVPVAGVDIPAYTGTVVAATAPC